METKLKTADDIWSEIEKEKRPSVIFFAIMSLLSLYLSLKRKK